MSDVVMWNNLGVIGIVVFFSAPWTAKWIYYNLFGKKELRG